MPIKRARHHFPCLTVLCATAFIATVVVLLLLLSYSSIDDLNTSCSKNKQDVLDLTSLKRFHGHSSSFCQRLPDAPAAYIWSKITLPHLKISSRELKRAIANAPSQLSLRRLFSKLEDSSGPIDIHVLLSSSDDKWPEELHNLINSVLGPGLVRMQSSIGETANYSSADIIIDARAKLEMNKLQSNFADLVGAPDASNALHDWKQQKIRSLLLETAACPLVIIVNDTPFAGRLLSDSVYTRTVQRLAHWYQLGYIHSTTAVYTSPNLEQAIAFAFLEWTIDYCSSSVPESTMSPSVLLPGIQELVESGMPPILTRNTAWQTISGQWEETKKQQHRSCIEL